jgi:hypothetical protein
MPKPKLVNMIAEQAAYVATLHNRALALTVLALPDGDHRWALHIDVKGPIPSKAVLPLEVSPDVRDLTYYDFSFNQQSLATELVDAIQRVIGPWADAQKQTLPPLDALRAYLLDQNPSQQRLDRKTSGCVPRGNLYALLDAVAVTAIGEFVFRGGLSLPPVLAAVFPFFDELLLAALLERGFDVDASLPKVVRVPLRSELGFAQAGVLSLEPFQAGTRALDILERAETILSELDRDHPVAEGEYGATLRTDARAHLPMIRATLEKHGARRGTISTWSRPRVPDSHEPIVEAFEILSDVAGVPRERLYAALSNVDASDVGPFSYFDRAITQCALLRTEALANRTKEDLFGALISGRAETQVEKEVFAHLGDAPPDAKPTRYLPLDDYSERSKKVLGKSQLRIVAGTLKEGYWVVFPSKKGTELHRVTPASTELVSSDFAAWMLSEARALHARSDVPQAS